MLNIRQTFLGYLVAWNGFKTFYDFRYFHLLDTLLAFKVSLISKLFIFSTAGVTCFVAAVKCLPTLL